MTVAAFLSYSAEKQADLLQKHAAYIGKLKSVDQTVLLFQLDSFYVEVFYISFRKQIDRIRCFEDMNLLDQYLENEDFEPQMSP